jgi:hypothetical protein
MTTQPEPLTTQQLDDIETRAAHLSEYGTLTDQPLQADLDQLADKDTPALLAEVRRLLDENAQMRAARDVIASMYRDLDAQRDAVTALCDEQDRAARLFELPTPAWVVAVRAASAAPGAPLAASQPSEAPVEPETPTKPPEGRQGDSGAGADTGPGWCSFGEDDAPGAGCILPAGHEPANRHVVTPGDTDD